MSDESCAQCGRGFRYEQGGRMCSREVGVEVPGVYDGILYWQCPSCGAVRHRWPEGSILRKRAADVLAGRFRRPGRDT